RVPLKLAAGAESLKILNATVRGRGFSVALDTPKEGEAPALLVTSNDPLPVGKRTVNATIEYDLNGKATQSVIVSVTVLGLVRIDPNPIQAAFEEGKNEVTVNVKLTHVKGEAFNVKSVVARSSQLREVELPKAPAAEHTLALTFVRSPQRQSPRGFLTFEFDNGIGAQNVYAMFGGPAAQPAGQLPPVTPAAKP
ncbi:MAG TPA: hypothetical protein PLJ47_13000, partial [Candidatus Hydrogenedentes bacterium]|nr:hypothetical protein [Candidatus Hydrogenedentota bacterium]